MATSEEVSRYSSAKSFLKVQGVLSIIFGGLGTLFGLPMLLIFILSVPGYSGMYPYNENDAVGATFLILVTLIFWILPHIYMIIAGCFLVRLPKPGLAKGLTIGNLVIGAILNYILLAFAIVSLAQSTNYQIGYKK